MAGAMVMSSESSEDCSPTWRMRVSTKASGTCGISVPKRTSPRTPWQKVTARSISERLNFASRYPGKRGSSHQILPRRVALRYLILGQKTSMPSSSRRCFAAMCSRLVWVRTQNQRGMSGSFAVIVREVSGAWAGPGRRVSSMIRAGRSARCRIHGHRWPRHGGRSPGGAGAWFSRFRCGGGSAPG